MECYIFAENCRVDVSSAYHFVVKNEKETYLRPQCWLFLVALINAKKHERVLTYEIIGEKLWSEDGGWDEGRKVALKEIVKEIRNVIGSNEVEIVRGVGYILKNPVREVHEDFVNSKTLYFERLWSNHYKGRIRDFNSTARIRELIDYFVLPTITDIEDQIIEKPFAGNNVRCLLMAGSGFGKSTLLDIVLLCNVLNTLSDANSCMLSDNTREKKSTYDMINKFLFGTTPGRMFPVYIQSELANECKYESVLELAEGHDVECFTQLVDEANSTGSLLFLIDSIDEVEADYLGGYLTSIEKMLTVYPNAKVIYASRFLGKKSLPFRYRLLYIKELGEFEVKRITYARLPEVEANAFVERVQENKYLDSLTKNPFMLMTILEIKGNHQLHHLLKSIVTAIIDCRWQKHRYGILSEDIKLLLGFLACKFVFGNKEKADIVEIRQCFLNAGENLRLHGVSYDVPTQNIEYFLKTLSSQSGILNIYNTNHIEEYVFQDRLVMCWLAANYICKVIDESKEIHDREGIEGILENIFWLNKFLNSFSSRNMLMSESSTNTLVMLLVMISDAYGPDIQISILYYLICRDALEVDKNEKRNIRNAYSDILRNSFGENDITNTPESKSYILIQQMIGDKTEI